MLILLGRSSREQDTHLQLVELPRSMPFFKATDENHYQKQLGQGLSPSHAHISKP